MEEGDRGLSTTSVALLFLLGVAVCAVFFSFGFLLGYKERSSSNTAEVERVTPTGDTPPVVNPPPEKEETSVRHNTTPAPVGSAAQPSAAQPATQGTASGPGGHVAPETPVPAAARQPATGGIVLQVAALQTRQDAEALVKILKERGYPVLLVTPEDAHANDNLFRVRVGPFQSRDEQEKTRQKLVTEGFKPFIKR